MTTLSWDNSRKYVCHHLSLPLTMGNCIAANPSRKQTTASYKSQQAGRIHPARKAMCVITGLEASRSLDGKSKSKNHPLARPGDLMSNKFPRVRPQAPFAARPAPHREHPRRRAPPEALPPRESLLPRERQFLANTAFTAKAAIAVAAAVW